MTGSGQPPITRPARVMRGAARRLDRPPALWRQAAWQHVAHPGFLPRADLGSPAAMPSSCGGG